MFIIKQSDEFKSIHTKASLKAIKGKKDIIYDNFMYRRYDYCSMTI